MTPTPEPEAGIATPSSVERDVAVVLAAHFGLRPWSEMAEDRADLRSKFRAAEQPQAAFDINEHTRSDCRYAARDLLDMLETQGHLTRAQGED